MIPVLYDKYETDFLSNGLGQLGDCLTCTVTEEINGIYELELTYPMTGAYYEQLINFGGVVACTHDHNGDIQLFDIYKYDAPIDGIVTFYGSHVSYRLGGYIMNFGPVPFPEGYTAPSTLFNYWNGTQGKARAMFRPLGSFVFTDHTGIIGASGDPYFSAKTPFSVRDAMLNTSETNAYEKGSILQLWKGEWKFDNFNVDYYTKRGTDRGVQIRYGKNMVGVQRTKDSGGIVSVIVPYWKASDGTVTNYSPVYYPHMEYVVSPWEANAEQMYSRGEVFFLRPADMRASVMDISSEFETAPTQAQVNDFCYSFMGKASTWRANDNITVEFLDLYGTPEYAGIDGLSNCLCGDFVSILYPQLGIVSDGVEIMSLKYDVLAERVLEMQLNSIRTTLAQVIIDSIGGSK